MPTPRTAHELPAKGKALLRVIVGEIRSARIDPKNQRTFIPYSEALAALGQPNPEEFSGRRLQREGLTELNEWTRAATGLPHVCGLIVNKSTWLPSEGYSESHGFPAGTNWEAWWRTQTADSVTFDWSPYL